MNFDNVVVIFMRGSHDALRKRLVKTLVLVIMLIFPQTLTDETSEENPFALETSVIVRGRRHVHLLPLPRIGRILPPLPSTWNLLLQSTLAVVENWGGGGGGRGGVGARGAAATQVSEIFEFFGQNVDDSRKMTQKKTI